MAATMDPKPEKLQQNITLKFRNLKVGRKEQIIKRSKVPVKISYNYITDSSVLGWNLSLKSETSLKNNYRIYFRLLTVRGIAYFGMTTAKESEYQASFIISRAASYIYITLL